MCVRVFVLLLCLLSVQGGRLFAVVRGIDSLARNEKCAVVTGVVYDVQGETIAGVNIIEKGTMNGVTTDREGKFSLEVDLHGTLIVSFVGYRTQIIPIDGRTDFVITLARSARSIPAMPIAESRPPIVVGIRQTNRERIAAIEMYVPG